MFEIGFLNASPVCCWSVKTGIFIPISISNFRPFFVPFWLGCSINNVLWEIFLYCGILLLFGVLPFIMTWHWRADRKRSWREKTGSGKVLKLGFELGMPITQRRYMSAHLLTRLLVATLWHSSNGNQINLQMLIRVILWAHLEHIACLNPFF